MRKLRLVAVIIFGAWGGSVLYKYLSDDGKVLVSREKLPESETVTNLPEILVEIQETTSMEEYVEAHKNDITEIVKQSLTDDAIELKIEEAKPDFETVLAETIKDVDIYKKDVHKPIKHKKFKYCVKIEHKNDTPNELIIRQLRNE